jgi:hypothetical protein
VIIAADTKVDLGRFVGKRIYETGTKEALKHGDDVVAKALASPIVQEGDGGAGSGSSAPAEDGAPAGARAAVKQVYQHLMTGVSYMLPFVVAGGLMIAISFAVNINANDPDLAGSFAGRLFSTGVAALTLFLPVFAGYISFSIADRPGLVPGFIGGYLASQVGAGFLGALLAGFFAGYVTRELANRIKLPVSMAGLKPVLILPLLSTLAVGLVMYYVIGGPISWVQDHLTDWLSGLQGSNAVVLGLILGAMMAADMGGPLNKVAYTFAVGLIGSGVTGPMAAVMAAGMTPPIGLALHGHRLHPEPRAGRHPPARARLHQRRGEARARPELGQAARRDERADYIGKLIGCASRRWRPASGCRTCPRSGAAWASATCSWRWCRPRPPRPSMGPWVLNCQAPDEGNMHTLLHWAPTSRRRSTSSRCATARDELLRDDRARGGRQRPDADQDHRRAGRRRVGDQRPQVVHLQRPARSSRSSICRTEDNPDLPQAANTAFIVDLPSEGWNRVREVETMHGPGGHSEIVIEDLRVPLEHARRSRPGPHAGPVPPRAGSPGALHALDRQAETALDMMVGRSLERYSPRQSCWPRSRASSG